MDVLDNGAPHILDVHVPSFGLIRQYYSRRFKSGNECSTEINIVHKTKDSKQFMNMLQFENSDRFLNDGKLPRNVTLHDFLLKPDTISLIYDPLPDTFVLAREICDPNNFGMECCKWIYKELLEGIVFLNRKGYVHCGISPNTVCVDLVKCLMMQNGDRLDDLNMCKITRLETCVPKNMFPETYKRQLNEAILAFTPPEIIFRRKFSPRPSIDVFSASVFFFWFLNRDYPYNFCTKNVSFGLTFVMMCNNYELGENFNINYYVELEREPREFYSKGSHLGSVPNWKKVLRNDTYKDSDKQMTKNIARNGMVMDNKSRLCPIKMLEIVNRYCLRTDVQNVSTNVSAVDVTENNAPINIKAECFLKHKDYMFASECNYDVNKKDEPYVLDFSVHRMYDVKHLSKILMSFRECDVRLKGSGLILNKSENRLLNKLIQKEFITCPHKNIAEENDGLAEFNLLKKINGQFYFPCCYDLIESELGEGDMFAIKNVEYLMSVDPTKNAFEHYNDYIALFSKHGTHNNVYKHIMSLVKKTK